MKSSPLPSLRTAFIFLLCTAFVAVVTWFVPALLAATTNVLFRVRGTLPLANDIVIVAIDDDSLQRIGQWPWPRHVMAKALDQLSLAKPAAIGLDVIYAEPSNTKDDESLHQALESNGRVILPTQLYEGAAASNSTIEWLRPLPTLSAAAAGLGHVHVAPSIDGVIRNIQLSKADSRGEKIWAFGLQVLRVAESIGSGQIKESSGALQFGAHRIAVQDETEIHSPMGININRANEMLINYAGPAGTFTQYSFADLYEGKLSTDSLRQKIVLIGSVAASMGDSRVVPFMHFQNGNQQGGQEMPGVEIHANIINTVRHNLVLRACPDWLGFLCAFFVILLVAVAIDRLAGWRQVTALGVILLTILLGNYWLFAKAYWLPPLAPMLTGFIAIVPLLLNRALNASRELDVKLAALVQSQKGLIPERKSGPATMIEKQWSLGLPRSLNWKLKAVDDLTAQLVARMSFINRTLSSMTEGVLVTDLNGRVIFSNREAQQLFADTAESLLMRDFVELMQQAGKLEHAKLDAAIKDALNGKHSQLEYTLQRGENKHFTLSLSPLATESEPHQSIGIVALLADITKRVALDKMKTETLQLVSHELRTPLTSIQGLSDVLLKFPVDAEQTREMHVTIHQEAVRLGETINRYLDLTRLESGVQKLRMEPLDVAKLFRDAMQNVSGFVAERQITVEIKEPPALPVVMADEPMILQAVTNLLSNAIKYSPRNTIVTLSAASADKLVLIHVADEGLGIPAEARERIFEKFYRLSRDTESQVIGTGLGLALVKEIVELHHGKISFESRQPAGTIFTISLPVLKQD